MTDPLLPGPLWLVGCGNMAGAMLARWLEQGVDPAHVSVIRPSGAGAGEGIRVTTDFPEDEVPAIVLLGMKPYQLDEVAPGLAPILDAETILVSILAGVELASLRARFATPRTIVRAMPNLPVRIGKGVVCLTSAGPAFLFRFIEALAEAAEGLGLSFDQAQRLAIAMVDGAAALAAASDE